MFGSIFWYKVFVSVDWGVEKSRTIPAEGNQRPVVRSSDVADVIYATDFRNTGKKHWSEEELLQHIQSALHVQEMSNAVIYAIEKARHRARRLGTSEPIPVDKLDGLLLPNDEIRGNLAAYKGRERI